MRRRRRATAAFTFVELLIVTGIICVLGSILFPVFGRAREKARQMNCLHNLKEVGLALHLYSYEACGHFPARDDDFGALAPYLPVPDVLLCPTAAFDRSVDAGVSSYCFKGGLEADAQPDLIIACERNRTVHNEGGNVLFMDGHAKFFRFRPSRPEDEYTLGETLPKAKP